MARWRMATGVLAAWVGIGSCSERAEELPLVGTNTNPIIVDVYASTNECTAAGRLDHASCLRAQREAQTKHPKFAQKFAQQALCEREAGNLSCSRYRGGNGPFWSPQPVGFLVCFAEDGQCSSTIAAPIYELVGVGKFTGVGGGYISYSRRERPHERKVVARVIYPRPVI
jgi:uncharacterized protein YgiB involved in biofilm formation